MRIIKKIEVEGEEVLGLFDTGATYTYVREELTKNVLKRILRMPFKVAIGGKSIEVDQFCLIGGKIDGLDFDTIAIPVDEIGKVDEKEIDVLIGALTMEQWEIIPNPKDGTLDLSGLRRREFTEF